MTAGSTIRRTAVVALVLLLVGSGVAAPAAGGRRETLTTSGFHTDPTISSCADGDSCSNGALFNYQYGTMGVHTRITRNAKRSGTSFIESSMHKVATHTVTTRATVVEYTVHWSRLWAWARPEPADDAAQHSQSLLRVTAVITGCPRCTLVGDRSHTIAYAGDASFYEFEGDDAPAAVTDDKGDHDQTVRLITSDGSSIPIGTTVELRPAVVSRSWFDADDVDPVTALLAPPEAYRTSSGTSNGLPGTITAFARS